MRTRIIKVTTNTSNNPVTNQTYYVAQYKKWWQPFIWHDIKWFYKSEIADMPGYWTSVNDSYESAVELTNKFHDNLNVTRSEVAMINY